MRKSREEYLEYQRRYREEHKEELKRKAREKWANNPIFREQRKKWRETNKEKVRGYYKKNYKPVEKVHKGTLVSNPNEIWQDIEGTDGWYMISNEGRVWSWKSGRFLKYSVNKIGYVHVTIGGKSEYLHRIIAKAFISNPNNYKEIDHIDTNPLNNQIDNLRWVQSHKENMNNPITLLKMKDKWENQKSRAIMTAANCKSVDMYTKDGEFIKTFDSIRSAAEYIGVDGTCVSAVCRGKQHSTGGYSFKYHDFM